MKVDRVDVMLRVGLGIAGTGVVGVLATMLVALISSTTGLVQINDPATAAAFVLVPSVSAFLVGMIICTVAAIVDATVGRRC